jgi:hypothetical protein
MRCFIAKLKPVARIKSKYKSAKSSFNLLKYRFISSRLKAQFKAIDSCQPSVISESLRLSFVDMKPWFVYKDESWSHVQNLNLILEQKRSGKQAIVDNNDCKPYKWKLLDECMIVDAPKQKNNWVYLLLDYELGSEYLFNVDVTLQSLFHEFQIAFRHHSIAERYRFRVVDNASLDFEVIGKGYFFHKVLSVPFSFTIGKCHNVKLAVKDNAYYFLVDNAVVMSVFDSAKWFTGGSLALIFYDWQGTNDIKLVLENLSLHGS